MILFSFSRSCSSPAAAAKKRRSAREDVELAKYRYAASAALTKDVVSTPDGTLRVLRPEGMDTHIRSETRAVDTALARP
jgi:hypothetical protein